MYRTLMAVCILFCFAGCASKGDQSPQPESVGHSSSASTWTGSISTRSPTTDNSEVSTTSTIGRPGIVTNADAGFCWITNISGSFRGLGEYALIAANASGYYKAIAQSNTSYDGVTGVGPAMTMKCRNLTDFTNLSNVPSFSSTPYGAFGAPPTGGVNYGQTASSVNSGSMYPWAGIEGRLNDAGSATWMISAMDHASDTAFARWAQACPLDAGIYCQMNASAWETDYASHTWTYSVTGASATNNSDVQLISASGQECYLDGIWGFWTSGSSARVETQVDGYWHLVTTKGSAAIGIGAYAACFPLNQGF